MLSYSMVKEARWNIYKNASCCTEYILETAPYKKSSPMVIYLLHHKSSEREQITNDYIKRWILLIFWNILMWKKKKQSFCLIFAILRYILYTSGSTQFCQDTYISKINTITLIPLVSQFYLSIRLWPKTYCQSYSGNDLQ